MSISALWFLITLSSLVSYIIYGMFNLTKPDQKKSTAKAQAIARRQQKKGQKKRRSLLQSLSYR